MKFLYFSYLGFAFGKNLRHFADIVGFLILHQLLIIARNVAQFHGNCLVALVYRWSLRVSFLPLIIEVKKYFIILLALAAIAGLGTHAAWSSNGLPRIDNKTLARLAQQHPVVVLFRHAERCDRSTNQCLSDKTGITVKGTRMPVNWATLLALTSLISIFIPVIPSGPFSRRPGFPRVKS